ncbi:DUF3102 domain-containing protein [Escherichia coli]|uniref:DUF3102 domain-containing protein n=1 Tax=Escherichia coli TaxID=562 RepID=UPI0003EFA155|nr:DUF3102 domain-containing protein [Escherichia coli]DAU86905.1 MAG TPA: Protein of unknown function (DUF3102) [Caudoviricetes sp.]EEQ6524710.1 DUF3102 domain-containing protein [Escherichia coli]EEQ9687463.1 DUF3102 domain-containing protein [Escherichia coli]EEQ9771962.1 DUF3102 domain-containing protein [Escherichia coli]EFA9668200.1 DUF3102 domain-containing protein [Escherichia coli]
MARQKSPPVELVPDAPLNTELNVSLNALAEHRIEIMQQFGDGLPYERDRVVHEARFYMSQSAEAMLEAGKRLVILKENEPHGEFIELIEKELGLPYRTSVRMMQASTKYLSPALKSNMPALAHLGKTKLFELMAEDDDELTALTEGGTVAGLTLDDIDRMTSRELRAALREAREDADAQRRVLADKNSKIDNLSTQLAKKSRIAPPPPDVEDEQLRKEVMAIAFEAEAIIRGKLHEAFTVLNQHHSALVQTHPHAFMTGLLCQIDSATVYLREEFGLAVEPRSDAAPEWVTNPTPKIERPDWMTTDKENAA